MADSPAKVQAQAKSTVKGKVEVQKWRLDLRLQDAEGKPLANAPYTLTLTGAPRPKPGTPVPPSQTGPDGKIDVELPPGCRDGVLVVGGRTYAFKLDLPPAAASGPGLLGLKARLRNLGYNIPSLDTRKDDALKVALAAFQADHDLGDPDGEPSDATLKKLEEVHGC